MSGHFTIPRNIRFENRKAFFLLNAVIFPMKHTEAPVTVNLRCRECLADSGPAFSKVRIMGKDRQFFTGLTRQDPLSQVPVRGTASAVLMREGSALRFPDLFLLPGRETLHHGLPAPAGTVKLHAKPVSIIHKHLSSCAPPAGIEVRFPFSGESLGHPELCLYSFPSGIRVPVSPWPRAPCPAVHRAFPAPRA